MANGSIFPVESQDWSHIYRIGDALIFPWYSSRVLGLCINDVTAITIVFLFRTGGFITAQLQFDADYLNTVKNQSNHPMPMTTTMPTTNVRQTTTKFRVTQHPVIKHYDTVQIYHGPNGIYELAGLTILARCPAGRGDKRTNCLKTEVTRCVPNRNIFQPITNMNSDQTIWFATKTQPTSQHECGRIRRELITCNIT